MSDYLRVYISSTYSDLGAYREAVLSTLLRFGFVAVSLDEFGATDESPLVASGRALEGSDIILLLLAHRLGYVPPEGKKSIVELEYERAVRLNKPVLVFILDDTHPWPPDQMDVDPRRVKAFRERLKEERVVSFFTTPDDLGAKVAVAISQYSRHIEGIPVAPPPPEAEVPDVTLADVVGELKAVRTEVSLLQQMVAETFRRPTDSGTSASGGVRADPADFLGAAAGFVDPCRCFVIMPYSEHWSGAVERIILEICTEVGLEFSIAKNMEGRFIPNDIWRGVTGAGIIVADLSGVNPNVTYEVGLADVLGRDVVIIVQEAKVPFDFLGQRLILYEDSLSGTLTLREELTDRLKRYKASIEPEENSGGSS